MSFCITDACIPDIISPNACNLQRRPGGIERLVIAACSLEFYDIRDIAEWCEYYQLGLITFTHKLIGEKSEATHFMRQLYSCGPETAVGREVGVEMKDFNADDLFFSDYDFYNKLQKERFSYKLGWLTCDDRFYGWVPNTIAVDDVIENQSVGLTYWQIRLKYHTFHAIKPVKLPMLVEIICGGCVNVPPPPPSCCKRWRPVISAVPEVVSAINADVTVSFPLCPEAFEYIISYTTPGDGTTNYTATTSHYVITGRLQGESFFIEVVAICGNGLTQGPFSTSGTIPTWPCCAPLNGANNFRLVNVVDTGNDGANAYDITSELDMPTGNCAGIDEIRLEYNVANGGWLPLGNFPATSPITTMQFFLPSIIAGNVVRFRYQSLCSNGLNSDLVEWSGTFTGPACCKNHNFNFRQTSVLKPGDPLTAIVTLNWTQCADATEYTLSYGPDGGPLVTEIITAPAGTTDVELPGGQASEFNIFADCATGRATPTSTIRTTTPAGRCCPPLSVTWDYGNVTDDGTNYTIPYTIVPQTGGDCLPAGTDFNVRWRRQGTLPWNTSVVSGVTGNFSDVPISEAGYLIEVEIQADCAGPDWFRTTLQLTCCEPTNVTGTFISIAANIANIRVDWTECYQPGAVEVEYRLNGAGAWAPAPSSPFAIPPATIGITILPTTTSVDVRVRTRCGPGSNSNWVTPSVNIPVRLPCCAPSAFNVNFAGAAIVSGPDYDVPYTYTLTNNANCSVSSAAEYRWRETAGVWSNWIALPLATGVLKIPPSAVGKNLEIEMRATCGGGVVSTAITRTGTICCAPDAIQFAITGINPTTAFVDARITRCTTGNIEVEYQLSGAGAWLPLAGSPFATDTIQNAAIPITPAVTSINLRARTICGATRSSFTTGTPTPVDFPPCCPPAIATIKEITLVGPQYKIVFNVDLDSACSTSISGITARYKLGTGAWVNLTGIIEGDNEFFVTSSVACGTSINIEINYICLDGTVYPPSLTRTSIPQDDCLIQWGASSFGPGSQTTVGLAPRQIRAEFTPCPGLAQYEFQYSLFNSRTNQWEPWDILVHSLVTNPTSVIWDLINSIYTNSATNYNQVFCSYYSKIRFRGRSKCSNDPSISWGAWTQTEVELSRCAPAPTSTTVPGGIINAVQIQSVCLGGELYHDVKATFPNSYTANPPSPCTKAPEAIEITLTTDYNPTGIIINNTSNRVYYNTVFWVNDNTNYSSGYVQDAFWRLTTQQLFDLFGGDPCSPVLRASIRFRCDGVWSSPINTNSLLNGSNAAANLPRLIKNIIVEDNGSDCDNIKLRITIDPLCIGATATSGIYFYASINGAPEQLLTGQLGTGQTVLTTQIPRTNNGSLQVSVSATTSSWADCRLGISQTDLTIPACTPCCIPNFLGYDRPGFVDTLTDCARQQMRLWLPSTETLNDNASPGCDPNEVTAYRIQLWKEGSPDSLVLDTTIPIAATGETFWGGYTVPRELTTRDYYIRVRAQCGLNDEDTNPFAWQTMDSTPGLDPSFLKVLRYTQSPTLVNFTGITPTATKGQSQAITRTEWAYPLLNSQAKDTYCGPGIAIRLRFFIGTSGGQYGVYLNPIIPPDSPIGVPITWSNILLSDGGTDTGKYARVDITYTPQASNGIVTITHRLDSPLVSGNEVPLRLDFLYANAVPSSAKTCCNLNSDIEIGRISIAEASGSSVIRLLF